MPGSENEVPAAEMQQEDPIENAALTQQAATQEETLTEEINETEQIFVGSTEEYNNLTEEEQLPTEPVISEVSTETVTETTIETTTETTVTEPIVHTDVTTEETKEENTDGSTTVTTTTTTETTESVTENTETVTVETTTETTTTEYEVTSAGSYITDNKETAEYIEQEEISKQEAIKEMVEEHEEGSYEYTVEMTDIASTENKADEVIYDTKAEAETREEELVAEDQADADKEITNIVIKETASTEEREEEILKLTEAADAVVESAKEQNVEIKKENIIATIGEESSSLEVSFRSTDPEEAKKCAEAVVAAAASAYKDKVINAEVVAEPLKGKKANEEDKGYTVTYGEITLDRKTWEYNIDINVTITGAGFEEIEIDFWDGQNFTMQPGDAINANITITNLAENDYVIDGYTHDLGEYYKWMKTSTYNNKVSLYGEDYGKILAEDTNAGYTAFTPNSAQALKENAGGSTRGTEYFKEYIRKNGGDPFWPTSAERSAADKNATTENLLAFYNEKMGTNYTSLADAYNANALTRGMEWEYNDTEAPEEYWDNAENWKDSESGALVSNLGFKEKITIVGETIDNFYQNMRSWFGESILLKAVRTYKALVEVDDIDYTVEYDETNHTYAVDVEGFGTYNTVEVQEDRQESIKTEAHPVTEKTTLIDRIVSIIPAPAVEKPAEEPVETPEEPTEKPVEEPEEEPSEKPVEEPAIENVDPEQPIAAPETGTPETPASETPVVWQNETPTEVQVVRIYPVEVLKNLESKVLGVMRALQTGNESGLPDPNYITPETDLPDGAAEGKETELKNEVLGAARTVQNTSAAQPEYKVLGALRTPLTGDDTAVLLWGMAAALSLTALVGWMIIAKKKERENA